MLLLFSRFLSELFYKYVVFGYLNGRIRIQPGRDWSSIVKIFLVAPQPISGLK